MNDQVRELEEQVELLRQQLDAVTGSPQEIGALQSLKRGMTPRLATMLFILVKRSPATVSTQAFHSILHGHLPDGGPDPQVFCVHIRKLRDVLERLDIPGEIDTVWNSGYRANADLVKWVRDFYVKQIP